jgi:phosphatidylglycerophosphatase A
MAHVILFKMKDQKNTFWDNLALLYLSFLGTGYSPKAPGTVGSLATIPIIFLLYKAQLPFWILLVTLILITAITCLITENIQKKFNTHDPGWIVIDEVLGMLVTWLFIVNTFRWVDIALVFGWFRFFDIIKFWPASYFDKKVHHGMGTILDDIISGIYAGLAVIFTKMIFGI